MWYMVTASVNYAVQASLLFPCGEVVLPTIAGTFSRQTGYSVLIMRPWVGDEIPNAETLVRSHPASFSNQTKML